jgi:hypothetical protein
LADRQIAIMFPAVIRAALLNAAELSPAARATVTDPFEHALTAAIAQELLACCKKLGLTDAVALVQSALIGLT